MSVERDNTLDYETPRPDPPLPTWVHFIALVFWTLVVITIYGGALAFPLVTAASVILVRQTPHLHAFGEPVQTTFQKVRMVAYPAALSAVFVPLAIWFRRRYRERDGAPGERGG